MFISSPDYSAPFSALPRGWSPRTTWTELPGSLAWLGLSNRRQWQEARGLGKREVRVFIPRLGPSGDTAWQVPLPSATAPAGWLSPQILFLSHLVTAPFPPFFHLHTCVESPILLPILWKYSLLFVKLFLNPSLNTQFVFCWGPDRYAIAFIILKYNSK